MNRLMKYLSYSLSMWAMQLIKKQHALLYLISNFMCARTCPPHQLLKRKNYYCRINIIIIKFSYTSFLLPTY